MGLISTGQLFQYAEQMALNAVFLKAQSPPPAPTYMALSSAAASGVLSSAETSMGGPTVNEYPIASGYARQNYGPIAATAASPSQIYNAALITWGPFTAAPGTCFWGIACDVASGTAAHPLAAFLLSSPRTPAIGDSLQSSAGTGVPGVGFLSQV
jgi:hypothetical protein